MPSRVVSFVPSWTETLLHAGVDVVGRTRFCIHPAAAVDAVPVVGGTKDWHLERVMDAAPDLVLLDEQENRLELVEALEAAGIPWHATNVRHLEHVAPALRDLATRLDTAALGSVAARWDAVVAERWAGTIADLPGVLAWGRRPEQPVENVVYLIWRDPWMAVSRDTFIGSMLGWFGLGELLLDRLEPYPTVVLSELAPGTLLLLSSEPYPFFRKREAFADLPFPHAFVDGAAYSWFGVRALAFLEAARDGAR